MTSDFELELHLGLVGLCGNCTGRIGGSRADCPGCAGTGVRLTSKGRATLTRLLQAPCGTPGCDHSDLKDEVLA